MKTKLNNRRHSLRNTILTKIKSLFKKRLPIFSWLPGYGVSDGVADGIAGLTVGLTVVPQSMAYAAIAGLSPEYGLYSSYIGCFIYIFLGSCRQVSIGPTAVMGLLTYETCGTNLAECAVLAGFYSGIFEILMAVLQLGWIVSFISEPVTVGFTSAAALTIISSQLSNLLGLSGRRGKGFIGYCVALIKNIKTIQVNDATLGILSFVVLIALKKLGDLKPPPTTLGKLLKPILWFVSMSRNIVIILATTFIAYLWTSQTFKLTGDVQGGFPMIGLPKFGLPKGHSNSTYNPLQSRNVSASESVEITEYLSFGESWEFLGAGPIVIALISILQNVAISKAFGNGQSVDATQEMLALGISNVVGGFFSSMPISGSFSRSAINEASGVRTPGGGFYTGVIVLLSLSFLTPTFYYIPKASLSAVIICAVMSLIDVKVLPPMWKISRVDFIACVITFCSSLVFGMEYGILIGVGISLTALLAKSLRPHLHYEIKTDEGKTGAQYLYIEPSDGVQFPSMDFICSNINKLTTRHESVQVIVINFNNWSSWDYTCASSFVTLSEGMKKTGKFLVFLHCRQDWIKALNEAGFQDPDCFQDSYLEKCLRKVTDGKSTSFLLNVIEDSNESSSFR